MNAAVSIVLLAAVLGVIVFLLSRRENTRRSQYGPAGLSEFRTDLPLDECFDRLDEHRDADEFVYECRRERTAAFCCISPCTSPPSSRWTPCIPFGWTPVVRP